MGLRLRGSDRADAIHQRVIRWNRLRAGSAGCCIRSATCAARAAIFPAEAIRLERIPETVLERIIGPVSVVIMQVSTAVRRLQHGRLQFYILYVVAGLVAMGVLVVLGGAR